MIGGFNFIKHMKTRKKEICKRLSTAKSIGKMDFKSSPAVKVIEKAYFSTPTSPPPLFVGKGIFQTL